MKDESWPLPPLEDCSWEPDGHFLFENEANQYADYVLPVASGVEKGGISRASEERRIVWNDKLIEPPGEARSDGWIWIELGKRLGFGDVLKEEYKDTA